MLHHGQGDRTHTAAPLLRRDVPQAFRRRRNATVNSGLSEAARSVEVRLVDLWSHTGPPWDRTFSADHFHPNDTGYGDWRAAFCHARGLPGEE